jgi:hypothetical protein
MARSLPGNLESPDEPWEALLGGDDLVTEIPAPGWGADGCHERHSCLSRGLDY